MILNKHIVKVKILFFAFIMMLGLAMVSGSFLLVDFPQKYSVGAISFANFFKYKIAFSRNNNSGLIASAVSAFKKENNGGLESSNSAHKKNANSVPVLVYHGIIDENPDRFSLTKDRFREHLFALKKAGYETVTMEDFYAFIKGEKELPEKSFVLTFDDGRKDSYYPADPLLKALDYKAVMFAATGASLPETPYNSKYYLSQKELERMVKSGRWDVQSHAVQIDGGFIKINSEGEKGNFLSNKMFYESDGRLENDADYKKRISDELANSRKTIEEKLGGKVISFSYPFGDYGQQTENYDGATGVISELMKQNYEMAFRQIWPQDSGFSFNYKWDYHYMLKRIEPSPEWSGEYLVEYLSGGEGKKLPYEEKFSNENQWKRTWGQVELNGGTIELGSREDTSGSFVFLDGSYPWTNYIFNTAIDWKKGTHVSLAARFKDEDNYAACAFSDDNLRIEQKIAGKTRNIVDKKNIYDIPKENVRLGISVIGDTVRCYVNGNEVAYAYYLSPLLANGGIGLKTWDRELGNSLIYVKDIKVEEVKTGEDVELALASFKEDLTVKESVTAEQKKKEEEAKKKQQAALNKKKQSSSSSVSSSAALSSSSKPEFSSSSSSISIPPIYLTDTSGMSTPYAANNFDDISGWKNLSGEVFVKGGTLHIASNASTTAGMTVLAGSKDWTDYNFRTKLDWNKGSTFTIIARYNDPKNYMSCTFSHYGEYARIYQTVNGKTKTLGKSGRLPIPFMEPWLNNDYGVSVNGNSIRCLVNNQWVLKYNTDEMPKSGGIGLKTWDANPAYSEVSVRELRAETIGN
ncbi:MAG: polysaccharide deacetylase family protein [Candidatus Paceibacter sp.]|nr:polysaccharide deacetylase family protein [Candidatus Paceibacter sp.]